MKKRIISLMLAFTIVAFTFIPAGAVYATGETDKEEELAELSEDTDYDCERHFLGLKAWYDGLLKSKTPVNGECQIMSPEQYASKKHVDEQTGMRMYVWTIVMNVISMIFGIAGYLAIGFVMWGGFQYILAQGDVNKTIRARKTVVNSIIGLALVMTASIISGMVAGIVSSARDSGDKFFLEIFNSAFLWAGIITAIMIVWGGIQYVTSVGDPQKATKAKNTILYSAIGLGIVILAATIVNVVVNSIQKGTL